MKSPSCVCSSSARIGPSKSESTNEQLSIRQFVPPSRDTLINKKRNSYKSTNDCADYLGVCSTSSLLHFKPAPLGACSTSSLLQFEPSPLGACSTWSLLHFKPALLGACSTWSLLHSEPAPLGACSI